MAANFPLPANARPDGIAATRAWIPQPIADFWRWWRIELGAVFRPLIERYWVDHSNVVDVQLDPDGALPTHVRLEGRNVRVLLARQSVLTRTATYPAIVEENLTDVIANDIDRQTPFKADQVYHTERVVRRFDAADGVARIDVELVVVSRRVADAALARARELGGSVYSLSVADAGPRFELLPESARPARRLSTLQKINIALASTLVLLVLAAIIVPSYLKRQEVIALQPLVEKARNEADATRKIEAEYQRLFQEYQFATAKKYSALPAIDIVESVTTLSPDTTWLKTLELKTAPPPKGASSSASPSTTPSQRARELILTGEASSAAKMMELFEQSPLFRNTTQRAQSRRTPNNSDDFQIATELKPRVPPEMISVLATPKPTSTAVNASTSNAPAKQVNEVKDSAAPTGAAPTTPTAVVSSKPSSVAPTLPAPPAPSSSYVAPAASAKKPPVLPPGVMPPNMPMPNGAAGATPMVLPNGAAPVPPIEPPPAQPTPQPTPPQTPPQPTPQLVPPPTQPPDMPGGKS